MHDRERDKARAQREQQSVTGHLKELAYKMVQPGEAFEDEEAVKAFCNSLHCRSVLIGQARNIKLGQALVDHVLADIVRCAAVVRHRARLHHRQMQ